MFANSTEWNDFLSDIAGYMSRLLAILKHTTLQLSILTSESGEKLCSQMDEVKGIVALWITFIRC